MERLISSKPFYGTSAVEIKAAKNEYEAFQVVIRAGENNHLKNVKIVISDLESSAGKIDKKHIQNVQRRTGIY